MKLFASLVLVGVLGMALGCDSAKPLPTSNATVPNPAGGKGAPVMAPPKGPAEGGGGKGGAKSFE